MVYKRKREQYQAIVQYVGDCMVKEGLTKTQAIERAQEKFNIPYFPTVYYAIRRCIEIHKEENKEQQSNG